MTVTAATSAFGDANWSVAYRILSVTPLDDLTSADLDRLAIAAYLIGEEDEAVAAWDRGYKRHADAGERAEAARCAFWAAFCFMMRGQMAHAGAWLRRGETLLGHDLDCAARGYLLIPALLGALDADDTDSARHLAEQASEIAIRFGDADLMAFATLGHGQALLAMGDEAAGLGRLDEVMLAVTSGDVGPIVSGIVYCAVILECMQLYDLARAAEWTAALDDWCRPQPDLVPYRGQCLVHQSQLLQMAGDWTGAAAAVGDARGRLSEPPHPALGLAYYQEGELARLRGDTNRATDAYRLASRTGYEPMPGLALLALQRGEIASAAVGIRRALGEAAQPYQRPGLLAAAVEIHVAAGDASSATEAAAELTSIAEQTSSSLLAATAARATGASLLASDRAADALLHLRAAGTAWQELNMPYEAARNAVLVGLGCAALGDTGSAALEFDNAWVVFEALGATPDLRHLSEVTGSRGREGPLSAREQEVLRLVAAGRTSREIAAALTISQHTARRHLENIFGKLGVNSRAAATAYAYEHDLL